MGERETGQAVDLREATFQPSYLHSCFMCLTLLLDHGLTLNEYISWLTDKKNPKLWKERSTLVFSFSRKPRWIINALWSGLRGRSDLTTVPFLDKRMLRVESDAGPGFVASASKATEYDGLVQRLDVCSAQSGPAQHPDALGLTSVSFSTFLYSIQ